MKSLIRKLQTMPITAKVSLAYTICTILQKSLSFITLPLFTRLLTTEQYGQYSIYTSWMGILTIFISLNLPYGSFSTAMVKYENRREEYIASVQGICTMLAGIFLVIYLPFSKFLNKIFELPTGLILLMVVEIVMHTALLCWNGKMRFQYKYKGVVGITLLVTAVSPLLAYFLVCNTEEKGYARIFGYSIVSIVVGACFYIYNFVKGKNFFNKKFWKYALGFNIPLIAYYLSQVVFNQSDRIMISHYTGTDKAGIYNVAYSLSTVLIFILNAINNSYVPWFYNKIKEDKASDNKKVANMIALLMSFMLLGVIWMAPEIIGIMAGDKYREAIWIVPPVTMSNLLLFYSQLFINVQFYYEKKNSLVWASVGSAIVNIILNAILIPRFGFIAAGYTTLVSYIIFAISNYFTMKKIMKQLGKSYEAYDLRSLVLIALGFIGIGTVGMILYEYMLIRICIAIIVLLIMTINVKKIYSYIKSL